MTRLTTSRATLDALEAEVKQECAKFSQDIKFWAEFQTGVKEFEPWMRAAEARKEKGLLKPETLEQAADILKETKVRTRVAGVGERRREGIF